MFGKLYSRRLFLSLVCPGKKRDLQEAGQHLRPPPGLSSPSHTHFSFYYCLLMRLFILPAIFWLYNAFFNPAQCVRKWLRRGGAFHQVFEDLQEFMHQSGLCQREDDFCFCKGMASFQGGSSKSCRRTGLGEEGGMIFFPKGGDCSFAQVQSRDLKARDLHRSEAIGRTTVLAYRVPLLRPISVLPLQAMAWYREGPFFMAEFCLTLCWAISMLIFNFSSFPEADTNGGGVRGGCLIRMT